VSALSHNRDSATIIMSDDNTHAKEAKAICAYLTKEQQKALCEMVMSEVNISPMTSCLTLPGSAPARPPSPGVGYAFELSALIKRHKMGGSECDTWSIEKHHTDSGFMN